MKNNSWLLSQFAVDRLIVICVLINLTISGIYTKVVMVSYDKHTQSTFMCRNHSVIDVLPLETHSLAALVYSSKKYW